MSFLLLTVHHLWVGTGAWAAGYKRPEGLRSMPPLPSLPTLCLDCQFGEPVEPPLSRAARRTPQDRDTYRKRTPPSRNFTLWPMQRGRPRVTRLNKTKGCALTFMVEENWKHSKRYRTTVFTHVPLIWEKFVKIANLAGSC